VNHLLEYLPPVTAPQPQLPQHGAGKYHGAVAANYDAKRETSDKWICEQIIIEKWLSELPDGSAVLDAPMGTGRFMEIAARKKFQLFGLDRQGDMLNQALKKAEALGYDFKYRVGNVLETGLPDKNVDCVTCIRLTRWMIEEHGPEGIQRLLRELQRVSRKRIILTARVEGHRWAVTTDLIESALDGWALTRNQAGYELAYRILMLEPK
jgi:ubiquinone/menaquinone biosynthesis C-methylase UbiE